MTNSFAVTFFFFFNVKRWGRVFCATIFKMQIYDTFLYCIGFITKLEDLNHSCLPILQQIFVRFQWCYSRQLTIRCRTDNTLYDRINNLNVAYKNVYKDVQSSVLTCTSMSSFKLMRALKGIPFCNLAFWNAVVTALCTLSCVTSILLTAP